MTITAVQITPRPAPTSTIPLPSGGPAGRTAEPADVLVITDIENLTHTNRPGCGEDNPYR